MKVCIFSNCPITHSGLELDFDWHGTITPSTVLPAGVPNSSISEHFVSLLIIIIVTINDSHHYQDDISPSCPCPACWCRLSTEKKGETQYENYLYRATSTSWHCISGDMRQTINIESEIRLSAWYQVTWDRNWHWKSGDLGETVGLPSSFPMGERMLQREDSWWWQVFLVFLFHALLFWYNKNCSSLSLECQSYSQTGFPAFLLLEQNTVKGWSAEAV